MSDGNGVPAARSELRQGLFMAMESGWLAAVLLLLDSALPPPGGTGLVAACLLYPASYGLAAVVRRFRPRPGTEIVLSAALFLAGLGVLTVLLLPSGESAPARLAAMAAIGGLAWLRGWMLVGRPVDLAGFAAPFQFGLVVLLVVLALSDSQSVPRVRLLVFGALFLASGLIGLWHARASVSAAPGRNGFDLRGAGLVALGLSVVLATGAALWIAVDRSALEVLLFTAHRLWGGTGQLLLFLYELLPEAAERAVEPAERPELPGDEAVRRQQRPARAVPGLLGGVLPFVVYAALAALTGFIVWHMLAYLSRQLRQRTRTPGPVYRRSGGSLRESLVLLWRGVERAWNRMRRWAERVAWRTLSDSSVRDIYRRMLLRLAMRGWRRRAHETPEEYRRRLGDAVPGGSADLGILTDAFVADRYGATRQEPGPARAAWGRLRGRMRKMRFSLGE